MVEKAPECTPTIHKVRVERALEKYRFSTVKSAELRSLATRFLREDYSLCEMKQKLARGLIAPRS